MTPSSPSSVRPGRARVLAIVFGALALGGGLVGCGPKQQFCVDAATNNYVCWTFSDAAVESDVNDAPVMEGGVIIVTPDANQQVPPDTDAPADVPADAADGGTDADADAN
ncbi:MAG TPA: hypothetical protein VHJ20_17455 [Polyangia bacterium]|nr:hypothetical protein [Polyangia bacterium]